MYEKIWKKYQKAVCSINFYGSSGCKLFGVSGFKHGNRIVSDDQIHNLKEVKEVIIQFYENDGHKVFREIKFDKLEFKSILPDNKQFPKLGLSYINLEKEKLEGLPDLEFCGKCEPTIGMEAVTIGYQFDTNNLALKTALVSSYNVSENGYDYIQYEGMVKPGSSGAPLLNLKTGKVIGVIANKELQIVKAYNEMRKIADNNLEILEKVKGKWTYDDIDPVQVMIVSQNQMKHMAREFFSNFVVEAGYALEIHYLKEMLETDSELDFE